MPYKGLINSEHLYQEIAHYLKTDRLEDLKIPLYVTVTDLNEGKQKIFGEGTLLKIIQASAAIPIIFNAVEIAARYYVDGGLVSNLPVEPLLNQCKKIIGVNYNPIGYTKEVLKLQDILERTLHLSIWGNTSKNIDEVDIYLEPESLVDFTLTDHTMMEKAFEIGYGYMIKQIELKNLY